MREKRFQAPAPSIRAASSRSPGMRVSAARIISATKGNQRQELIRISVVMALSRDEKNPTGASSRPVCTSSGLIIPPELDSSQRQMMTTTTVGTIQVSSTQTRAMRTPGKL
jgi:hypothetical protein